ncbi:uncharacterized protein LOC112464165, partial [Temnothorax curvispinosus]|uniref:Uncharacterized protein LOC112464165 n=1 Tax=Temnothorax curvispinosus TaxID=300111 RepID=A0A6J1QWT6_9HYME
MPKVDHELFPHLRDLQLADADPSNQDRINLLIGADIYGSILLEGLRKGSETEPVAQRTIFGWVIFGPYSSIRNVDQTTSLHATVSPLVDDELRKFWELEEIPFTRPLTKEEEYCENLFVSSHYRRPNGRYVVRLPFKRDAVTEFGNSLQIAVKSLIRLETRLSRNPALHEAYNRFLTEYEQLGHMTRITPSDQVGSSTFYMPHHPVLREANSTIPLRVVFNASSPTNSIRHPSDTDYQRIVWRPCPNGPIVHGRLLTVTYGQKPSPYLAKRSVKQLCIDEGARFPLAVLVLEESTYVDDALFGAYKQFQILEMRDQLNNLLKLRGFQLRKWASSHEELLTDVPHPSIWKTFVANRVSDIQTRLPLAKWGYVESKLNPADCASRGVEATTLRGKQLWWKGPPWLSQHSTSWPEHNPAMPAETIPERKSVQVLRQRTKWQQSCANLAKDELVIVRNELLPPTKWELGRIQKLYPDQDGRVRVVDVKTVSGIYKRPITKLCRLPISLNESQK